MSRVVGYARVSTKTGDQKTDLQLDALKKYGCAEIFEEMESGASRERPVLAKALGGLERGDVLVVWKVDRIARSLSHLLSIVERLGKAGVKLVSLTEAFDSETSMGKAVLSIMGAFAELERNVISERTKAGLAAAKARGVRMGRKVKAGPELAARARELLVGGMVMGEVAAALGVCPATVYNALARERERRDEGSNNGS